MANLIKEAQLDDRFSTQMNRLEGAANTLRVIVEEMQAPGGIIRVVNTQKMALRHVLEDLKAIYDKIA